MAEIPGVTIDWTDYFDPTLPRIIHIPAPLLEVTVQGLIDTVAEHQARLDNLVYAAINPQVNGGRQNLGGGLFVGLTTTLDNARVSFDARKISTSAGSVTTGDPNGVTLNDATATFLADGVEPGGWVVNTTDGSLCSVIRVQSETQIITDGLDDGVDDQWDIGDGYKIFNVEQGRVADGNAVAVDYLANELEAVLPTAGIQVIRSLDVSAALLEGSGGALTSQQVRDAMKLSPSAGAPDADSIDDQLSDLSTDVADVGTEMAVVEAGVQDLAAVVSVAFTYAEDTDVVVLQTWLQRNGVSAMPTAMSFILRTGGGVGVFSITDADATVDTHGVYSATVTSVVLERYTTYYATVTITDANGVATTVKGIYTT